MPPWGLYHSAPCSFPRSPPFRLLPQYFPYPPQVAPLMLLILIGTVLLQHFFPLSLPALRKPLPMVHWEPTNPSRSCRCCCCRCRIDRDTEDVTGPRHLQKFLDWCEAQDPLVTTADDIVMISRVSVLLRGMVRALLCLSPFAPPLSSLSLLPSLPSFFFHRHPMEAHPFPLIYPHPSPPHPHLYEQRVAAPRSSARDSDTLCLMLLFQANAFGIRLRVAPAWRAAAEEFLKREGIDYSQTKLPSVL